MVPAKKEKLRSLGSTDQVVQTPHSHSNDSLLVTTKVFIEPTKWGTYGIIVTVRKGENRGPLGYPLPPQHAAEVPQPQPNTPLLEALATATGGAINPDVSSLVLPVAPPEQHSLLPYLIPLAMAV